MECVVAPIYSNKNLQTVGQLVFYPVATGEKEEKQVRKLSSRFVLQDRVVCTIKATSSFSLVLRRELILSCE